MEIIFARHAGTQFNKEKRFLGVLDQSLNDVGRKQAIELANYLKDENLQKIYVSPLKRALETVQPISKLLNLELQIINELSQISFGELEGRKETEFKDSQSFDFVYPNGESYAMLYKRLIPFFEKLKEEKVNVLVISHGGVIRCARKYFERISDLEFMNFPLTNRSLYILLKENGDLKTELTSF